MIQIYKINFLKIFYKKIKKDPITFRLQKHIKVTILYHDKIDNSVARQIFTKTGPIAFLPISNDSTSLYLTLKNLLEILIKNIRKEEKLITKYNKFLQQFKIYKYSKFRFKVFIT